MQVDLKYIVSLISFSLFALLMLISYVIGKKAGIKKALYRTTYISICMLFAFVLAPYVNEYVLNYDLYSIEKSIEYKGLHFYRLIDFIEEIIVHNEVLNDIYNFVPSLKNLLMDFPQVIFIPFAYLLTYIIMKIIFYPCYAFLSYKRKRKYLYDKKEENKYSKTAGLLTCVQVVFVISIVLTPINGITMIYKDATGELIDENSTICVENKYLEKYSVACEIIEAYNISAFGIIGNSPVNRYVYNSLTRIEYNDKKTSLDTEIVSIAKAAVVLNKTGLLEAINIEDFSDVTSLKFHSLTEEDIDVVVEAFEQSLYTQDVIHEVYEWSKSYLDWLISDLINGDFNADYAYDDIVGELKIILKVINYILDNEEIFSNIKSTYNVIEEFLKLPMYERDIPRGIRLFFDIVYTLNVDYLIEMYDFLKNSKIYNDLVPKIIDNLLSPAGIHINSSNNQGEFNNIVIRALNLVKIIQNHRYIYDIMHLINDLTIDEVHYIASTVEYLLDSEGFRSFLYELIEFAINFAQLKLEIPLQVLYEINDWERECELVHLVIQIIYTYMNAEIIDYDKAWYTLTNYSDTVLFSTAFKFAIKMLPDVFTMWLAGKDYKYLVGEYVA